MAKIIITKGGYGAGCIEFNELVSFKIEGERNNNAVFYLKGIGTRTYEDLEDEDINAIFKQIEEMGRSYVIVPPRKKEEGEV
jgi:hypothetical protein